MSEPVALHVGDCLDVLKQYPADSIDAVVTDPPYGLEFMNAAWDKGVPPVAIWLEVFRVLKPGGHLLAFAGTRTQHRMAVNIEDAGFDIRDMIAWVYGCLSDDTEILINGRWVRYHEATRGSLALCYNSDRDTFAWEPVADLYVYDYDETAYRIQSEKTDKIVSRNHRVLVGDGDRYRFQVAETLGAAACVPVIESMRELLDAVPVPQSDAVDPEPVLREGMPPVAGSETHAALRTQGAHSPMRGMSDPDMEARCVAETDQGPDVLEQVQRGTQGSGLAEACPQGPRGVAARGGDAPAGTHDGRNESSVAGWRDVHAEKGHLQADKIHTMPGGVPGHGAPGRLRYGTPSDCGDSDRAPADSGGGRASCGPQSTEQYTGEPCVILEQQRPQAPRSAGHTRPDLARVTPIHYAGKVWCVRVPSGAFVARRNGLIFVTGNSGFPKALDVGKALDKQRTEDDPRIRDVCRAIRAAMDAMGYTSRDLAPFFGPCHPRLIDHWAARDTDSQPALPRPEQWALLRDVLGIGPELDREVAALNARKGIHGDAWQSREVVGVRVLADTTKGRMGFNGPTHSPDYKGETREVNETLPATDLARRWTGWKSALKPALEPITVAQKPFPGTIAGNVARYGVGAFNVDACRVPVGDGPPVTINRFDSGAKPFGGGAGEAYTSETSDAGRYPANLIHDGSDEVEAAFAVAGVSKSSGGVVSMNSTFGVYRAGRPHGEGATRPIPLDAGTASRFFYCAKANRADRDEGLDAHPDRTLHRVNPGGLEHDPRWAPVVRKNDHLTVKPTALMRYLCRLITPPGGVVLDPFMGSGSTGKAARLEGFRFVGIDLDGHNIDIARARIAHVERQGGLFTPNREDL